MGCVMDIRRKVYIQVIMKPIENGKTYLLDGKVKVVVVKSFQRSLMRFLVEVPGKLLLLVEGERLKPSRYS
jgi:hypothetical protein